MVRRYGKKCVIFIDCYCDTKFTGSATYINLSNTGVDTQRIFDSLCALILISKKVDSC